MFNAYPFTFHVPVFRDGVGAVGFPVQRRKTFFSKLRNMSPTQKASWKKDKRKVEYPPTEFVRSAAKDRSRSHHSRAGLLSTEMADDPLFFDQTGRWGKRKIVDVFSNWKLSLVCFLLPVLRTRAHSFCPM